jgi:glycine/D-amino acid oxidase-like deaminating enzyme
LSAGKIVLAAGIGNTALAPMIGLKVPLSPSPGQIIVTERVKPFLHYETGYLRQGGDPDVQPTIRRPQSPSVRRPQALQGVTDVGHSCR